ncbi:MAG: FumA C-terminus/TtdB family hydratase beta subunit [bacterium]
MINLQVPIDEKMVRSLRVGDQVSLSGGVITARDRAHKYLVEEFVEASRPKEDERENLLRIEQRLKDGVIYHCGPVVKEHADGRVEFVSAGPTTSIREEGVEAEVIERFGVRAVIGKGGMGARTLSALKEHGAVYLHAIGGAATFLARNVERVDGVVHRDFGVPEAMWEIELKDFVAVVTMDSHGGSLHDEVREASASNLSGVLASMGQAPVDKRQR